MQFDDQVLDVHSLAGDLLLREPVLPVLFAQVGERVHAKQLDVVQQKNPAITAVVLLGYTQHACRQVEVGGNRLRSLLLTVSPAAPFALASLVLPCLPLSRLCSLLVLPFQAQVMNQVAVDGFVSQREPRAHRHAVKGGVSESERARVRARSERE